MAPWRYGIDVSQQSVIGVDEAGRGCLAGPVVAASVMLDNDKPIHGLDDSKKLSPTAREALYEQIYAQALCVTVKAVESAIIDRINILQATFMAMRHAVITCMATRHVDFVLVDGNQAVPDLPVKQMTLVHGDSLVECIMAASIIAKVHRDRLMQRYDDTFPGYGFGKHKGYGTSAHFAALERLGPCSIHRMSFAPCRELSL